MDREPPDLRPPLEVGIHGVHRHRQWDSVQAAGESEFSGHDLQFVVLPDGTTVIEWDEPPGSYSGGEEPFVTAVRRDLQPPFRVRAVRRNGGFLAGARRITVLELAIEGDELTFRVAGDERELRVNGWPAIAGMELLERALGDRFRDYFVFGRRLSDRFWEIEVSAL